MGKQFFSLTGNPILFKDSDMAAQTASLKDFVWTRTPRPKWLYFVNFVVKKGVGTTDVGESVLSRYSDFHTGISFQVKYIDRPKASPRVVDVNQYNKRRLVHTGIDYDPVNLRFHDVVDSRVLKFWIDYTKRYFADFRGKLSSDWRNDISAQDFNNPPWGFQPIMSVDADEADFFERVEIYLFYGKLYTRLDLVRPKIISMDHDASEAAAGDQVTEMSMQLRYEGIVYETVNHPITQDVADLLGLDIPNYFDPIQGIVNVPLSNIAGGVFGDILTSGIVPPLGLVPTLGPLFDNAIGLGIAAMGESAQFFRTNDLPISDSALSSFGNFSFGKILRKSTRLFGNVPESPTKNVNLFKDLDKSITEDPNEGIFRSYQQNTPTPSLVDRNSKILFEGPQSDVQKGANGVRYDIAFGHFRKKGFSPENARIAAATAVNTAVGKSSNYFENTILQLENINRNRPRQSPLGIRLADDVVTDRTIRAELGEDPNAVV